MKQTIIIHIKNILGLNAPAGSNIRNRAFAIMAYMNRPAKVEVKEQLSVLELLRQPHI